MASGNIKNSAAQSAVDTGKGYGAQVVAPLFLKPEPLAAGDIFDGTLYGMVEFEFRNVTSAITIYRDLTDATTPHTGFYDQNGNGPFTTITVSGVYQFMGGALFKFSGGGTPTATARASQ